jgi:hypothetical protein
MLTVVRFIEIKYYALRVMYSTGHAELDEPLTWMPAYLPACRMHFGRQVIRGHANRRRKNEASMSFK